MVEKYYKPKEAAEAIHVGMNTLYALIHSEDSGFPACWITPRKCVIPVDALHSWMEAQAGKAAPALAGSPNRA